MVFKINTIYVRKLIIISLFIALQVILTRIFSITFLTARISLHFLPLALTSAMFGPLYGAIAAIIADLLGFALFPKGIFFPGFTLTAGLSGMLYGMFLYKRHKSRLNVIVCVIVVSLTQLILNTIWLYIIYDIGVLAMLAQRITTTIVMLPIQIYMILFFWNVVITKVNIKNNYYD